MTQDIGVPLYEGFYGIYYNPTPDSIIYPGEIEIYWKAFEGALFSFLESEIPISIRQSLVTLDLISDGEIAYPKDYVKLSFELRTNGSKVLIESSQWEHWNDFISKLKKVDREAKVENAIWQEQLLAPSSPKAARCYRRYN